MLVDLVFLNSLKKFSLLKILTKYRSNLLGTNKPSLSALIKRVERNKQELSDDESKAFQLILENEFYLHPFASGEKAAIDLINADEIWFFAKDVFQKTDYPEIYKAIFAQFFLDSIRLRIIALKNDFNSQFLSKRCQALSINDVDVQNCFKYLLLDNEDLFRFAPVFVIIFKDGKRQVKYLEPSYLKPHINNFQLCKFDIVMSDEKAKFLYEQYKDVWNKNYKA